MKRGPSPAPNRTRHPQARVVAQIGTIDEVIALARSQAAHLGLFLASGPVAGLRSEVLEPLPLVLAVSPGHPLDAHRQVTATILSSHAFVTGLQGSTYAALTAAALRSIGVILIKSPWS